jgi:hypothetical protein
MRIKTPLDISKETLLSDSDFDFDFDFDSDSSIPSSLGLDMI